MTYYNELLKQIDEATTCAELQVANTRIIKTLNDQLTAMQDQLAKVQPLIKLLTPPTSPDDVVKWISDLIDNVIKPLAQPAIDYPVKIAELQAIIGQIAIKVNQKASEFTGCEIT